MSVGEHNRGGNVNHKGTIDSMETAKHDWMTERKPHTTRRASISRCSGGPSGRCRGTTGKACNLACLPPSLTIPRGSTRTFQSTAKQGTGVSWAHGLRHGMTMHPRGRHLREGMILLILGGATQQNVDEHITPTKTRKGTMRMKEVLHGTDGNTWNRPVKEWRTVIAGPSRPRIVEAWSGIQTRPRLGEVHEFESGSKEGESREKEDQPMLGRLAPGLKKARCWPTGVKKHDEKITSTHRRTRVRERWRLIDIEEKFEGIENINEFWNTEFIWQYHHWFHLRGVSRVSATAWERTSRLSFNKAQSNLVSQCSGRRGTQPRNGGIYNVQAVGPNTSNSAIVNLAMDQRCNHNGDVHGPKQIKTAIVKQFVESWGRRQSAHTKNMMKHQLAITR